MKVIHVPILNTDISNLKIGDKLAITGQIFTGRDAILPKLLALLESNKFAELNVNLQGSVIFHTAVSPAGVGPTSSNKLNIENSIPALSLAGVKIHLGKGSLKSETVKALDKYGSIYAVIPPVTALLESKITSRCVIAFPEEGMEAMHCLEVVQFPAIIAVAHGESIFDKT